MLLHFILEEGFAQAAKKRPQAETFLCCRFDLEGSPVKANWKTKKKTYGSYTNYCIYCPMIFYVFSDDTSYK